MTDAQIDKIIVAVGQMPRQQQMLLLGSNGTFPTMPDDPPWLKRGVCAVLEGEKDATHLIFFGAGFVPSKLPTSHAAAVSMLGQGLDAAHASEEQFRKTGKGSTAWELFGRA